MTPTGKRHFLNDGARRRNRSVGDATGLTGLGIHRIEVAPVDASTEHHHHHHEAVFVLSATGNAMIGEDSVETGPGDLPGYQKGGAAHHIVNTGKTVLRSLVIGERAAHDVCDRPRAGKRLMRDAVLPPALYDLDALFDPGSGVGQK